MASDNEEKNKLEKPDSGMQQELFFSSSFYQPSAYEDAQENALTNFYKSEDLYACLKNEFVESKQDTSLREAKLLRIIISQIVDTATDFSTYKIKVKDLADLLNINSASVYRDIKEICRSLHSRCVQIERPNGTWANLSWVDRSEYDGKYITICLSQSLKPYLINLEKNYVQYQIKEITCFDSFYGLRLYEILKSRYNKSLKNKTSFTFTIDELRFKLNCQDKHTDFMHFNSRVLAIAIKDINNNPECSFSITFQKETEGKRVVAVTFFINPKK